MTFDREPDRPPHDHARAADRGAGGDLEFGRRFGNERGRQLRRGAEPCELTRYRRGLGAWSDWEDERMVSTDHFRQELLAQLGRAAAQGRIDILINSGDLYRSIARGGSRSGSCCDAMQEEFKMGDRLLLDRTNGSGMTVRYLLPRAN